MTEFLLPLTGRVSTRPYAVIDIESKDGDSQRAGFTRPFLAGWYDTRVGFFQAKGPRCIETMLAYACQEKHDGWIFYAHNGGSFDWLHFLPAIHAAGFYYEILTVGSTIQLLKVKRSREDKSRGWTFLDSAKLIPMSLEKAAKAFGVTLKKEHDLDLHEDDPSWREYLRTDCIATYEILVRYHELIEIQLKGEVGITAASTAMRTFRRGWQVAPIARHKSHHEMFRAAYYGGRVERFARKVQGVRTYDVNSSYPWSMTMPMPVGAMQAWEGRPCAGLTSGSIGFCQARVTVPKSLYVPVLPYRAKHKLLFPVGEFSGVWDYLELQQAERAGCAIEYQDSVWIEEGYPFSNMVRALFAYRDTNRPDYDEGLATVAKILLNSLYGKFGMKTEREKLVRFDERDYIPDGARPANPLDLDSGLWYVPEEADADYVIPQIAAHVTTLSRLKLWGYFMTAHERGILAYGDTDSVHTTADLSDMCGSELGKLKDEGKGELYTGEYLQPKLYMLHGDRGGEKLVMKGYKPPKAGKNAYFERVKSGETITFETLEKIGSLAARGFASPPRMRSIARSIKSDDCKRVMISDTHSKPVEV